MVSTVLADKVSRPAIAELLSPAASNASTSSSRAVRPAGFAAVVVNEGGNTVTAIQR